MKSSLFYLSKARDGIAYDSIPGLGKVLDLEILSAKLNRSYLSYKVSITYRPRLNAPTVRDAQGM